MSGLLIHADGSPVRSWCRCIECRPPDVDSAVAMEARRVQRVRRTKAAKPSQKAARFRRVIETYGGFCYYCGNTADTTDHLLPRSRGGTNAIDNLRPACKSCNGQKGSMTEEEFRAASPFQFFRGKGGQFSAAVTARSSRPR